MRAVPSPSAQPRPLPPNTSYLFLISDTPPPPAPPPGQCHYRGHQIPPPPPALYLDTGHIVRRGAVNIYMIRWCSSDSRGMQEPQPKHGSSCSAASLDLGLDTERGPVAGGRGHLSIGSDEHRAGPSYRRQAGRCSAVENPPELAP